MANKSVKRAFLASLMALILCVSSLLGTTYAWFTDSVTSANNKIVAGNLDVELYYQIEGQNDWTKVTDTTNIFKENALWEPGHTEVVKLKVVNEGSLALKYQLGVNVASEIGSVNAEGDPFKLSDFIRYGIVEGAQNYTRDEAIKAVDGTATKLNKAYNSGTKELLPTEDAIVTMVVYMPTTVGNEANHGKNYAAPSINLGLSLYATQMASEEDSFDKNYDKDAFYANAYVTNAVDLAEAIADAKDGDIIALMNDITLGGTSTFAARAATAYGLTIPADKEVIIDLNGFAMTYGTDFAGNTAVIANFGQLTVKDSVGTGKIELTAATVSANNGYATDAIRNEGKLVVEGGTIQNNFGGASYAINNAPGATATVNGGTIVNTAGTAIRVYGMYADKVSALIVNGGNISGTYGIRLQNLSTTVKSAISVTVNGGTIEGVDPSYHMALYSYGNDASNVTVALNGGAYYGDVAFGGGNKAGKETVTIGEDAVFYGDVFRYTAEGTEDIKNSPYTFVAEGLFKTDDKTYYIMDAAGLKSVADIVNATTPYTPTIFDDATVYLTCDIDLGGQEWIPIGDDRSQRTEFHGIFDGQNHTISNLVITKKTDREDENKSSYGLFGNVKGTVKNLTVSGVSISGAPKFIGALVGRLNDGLIENCHVINADVSCNNWTIGGLVGQLNNGTVKNCSLKNSTITGYAAVGGIAGIALNKGERTIENCTVENCTFVKNGSFGGNFDKMFGTIVGALYSGELTVTLDGCEAKNNSIDALCGYVSEGDTLIVDGAVSATTAAELVEAVKAGKSVFLMADVTMTETVALSNANLVLDGNGYTITQADSCTNTYALFDLTGGKATVKNVTFDGIKDGAVIRTVGVELNVDGITAKNCNVTQVQGLLRLMGKSTITNSTFTGNTCNMLISFNYDGANNDPQVLKNCVITNNVCNDVAAVYYVKGAGATIDGNKFIGNTVKASAANGNGATVYMGFTENNTVTNNVFDGNTVTTTTASKRVAGALMVGYETVITGNVFINNTASAEDGHIVANDVCASVYYTDIDLSGNYWGGAAPVENDDYFVEYPTSHRVIIDDYLTTYEQ